MEDYRNKDLNIFEEFLEGCFNLLVQVLDMFIRLFGMLSLFLLKSSYEFIRVYIFNGERREREQGRITLEDLNSRKVNFKRFENLLENKKETPIGLSLTTKKPVVLDLESRFQHTIVSGATGQGKTTLLKTLLRHSLKHKHPIIIIDPKGQKEDILEMKEEARKYGREKDFCLFSLSFPETSYAYNPLESGTSEQIKARLLDGLKFEHSYYKAQSALWLSSILVAIEFLNKTPSFNILKKCLTSSNAMEGFRHLINESKANDRKEILDFFDASQEISRKDLAGLSSQIASLDSPILSPILSPKEKGEGLKLSLSDVLQNKKIAYFQLNTNGYGESARQIGKMILQDLKVLSNQIQCGQKSFDYDFCPIFIDEFGSFATQDFIDFLKMARSSKMALHLFMQGLSDLKTINPEFQNQIIGNTIYKILFRQDVPEEVETWSKTIGTVIGKKQTYQIEEIGNEEEMSGRGSEREVKEMRVEFDVFKRLSQGQAILIDKFKHREDLFSVWKN